MWHHSDESLQPQHLLRLVLGVLEHSRRLIIAAFSPPRQQQQQSGVDQRRLSQPKGANEPSFGGFEFPSCQRQASRRNGTRDGKNLVYLMGGTAETNRCTGGVNSPFLGKSPSLFGETSRREVNVRGRKWRTTQSACQQRRVAAARKIQKKSFPDTSPGCMTHCQRNWEIRKCSCCCKVSSW